MAGSRGNKSTKIAIENHSIIGKILYFDTTSETILEITVSEHLAIENHSITGKILYFDTTSETILEITISKQPLLEK